MAHNLSPPTTGRARFAARAPATTPSKLRTPTRLSRRADPAPDSAASALKTPSRLARRVTADASPNTPAAKTRVGRRVATTPDTPRPSMGMANIKTQSRLVRRSTLSSVSPLSVTSDPTPSSALVRRATTSSTASSDSTTNHSSRRTIDPSSVRSPQPPMRRSLEPTKRATRPSMDATLASTRKPRASLESARAARPSLETPRTTRPSMDGPLARSVARRASVRGAPAVLTPSQQRAEAARKRREAADSAAADTRSTGSIRPGPRHSVASSAAPVVSAANARKARSEDKVASPAQSRKARSADGPSTPKAARGRLADRGGGAAADAPRITVTPTGRRLTGGGTPTRNTRARPSLPRSNTVSGRVSLPRDGDAVSRRLELGAKMTRQGGASRAEVMNAIAESTTGSDRLDGPDNVSPNKAPPSDSGSDHVLPRSPRKHSGALESFRRMRRESLEAEARAKAADAKGEESAKTDTKQAASTKLEDRPEPCGGLGESWATAERDEQQQDEKLVAPDFMRVDSARTARASGRFSDADVSLTGVSKLRESLGRRRSRGNQDLSEIPPPTLRRRSAKLGNIEPLSIGLARLSIGRDQVIGAPVRNKSPLSSAANVIRAPLQNVERSRVAFDTNARTDGRLSEPTKSRYSLTRSTMLPFSINDDRLTWADGADDELLLSD